jgi:hypothetical protein
VTNKNPRALPTPGVRNRLPRDSRALYHRRHPKHTGAGVSVIRRVNRPADQFTMVRNSFARDASLSFHARGVGLWLLSHAEGFETTTEGIARMAGVGRDQIRRALAELEAARYVRRFRERTSGGKLGGMVYEVQCEPFPPEEEENPRSNQRLETQALADQALVSTRHKKNTSKKITKEDPSGGVASPSAPPPAQSQEEPDMPRATQAEALFELPAAARRAVGTNPGTGPQHVTAAYVDSFRRHHGGATPSKANRGRVARDAKALLADRGVATTLAELTAAAVTMGSGRYTNLDMQLKISRDQGKRTPGETRPVAHAVENGEAWESGLDETAAAAAAAIAADPKLAAFMAGAA